MRKAALIFIILIVFLSSYGQKLPSKKEQYDFLKWYLKHEKMPPLSGTSEKLLGTNFKLITLNQMLSSSSKIIKSDYSYLKRQAILNKSQQLDTTLLRNVVWRTNFHPDTLHRYISMPIFSLNKRIVFIYYNDRCGGDCGAASVDAFIKTKGNKWKPLHVIVPYYVY